MATTKRNKKVRAHWRQVIHDYKASGLTISAYCREKSISISSFYQWKAKLKDKPSESSQSSQLFEVTDLLNQNTDSPQGLRWHIELDLGDGIKLNLSQR